MKKSIRILSSALIISMSCFSTSFAGQWIQDQNRPSVKDGVSNWRWQEDNGSYVGSCDLWLDGNRDGIYENYYFNSDGWMLADTETEYGQKIGVDGAALLSDGTVSLLTAPRDSSVITTRDYTLTLPDNWKNHFCYSTNGGNLYVDFYPVKPLIMDGKIRSSVTQTMFWLLQFDSREEMDETRALGMHDGWKYLGSHGGKYYVSCGPTDTAIEFYTDEEREMMQQMDSSLYSGMQPGLWNRMAFQ
ncbi:hypothetical protein V3C10_17905 [[Clostridium] symbiosum]|uniref:hypothetical protein n=1 Tax=Clostridium symbiosum TaxID=1512 RepID=UPI001D08733E|nr:hypothetical protein [[Clostridium] symbiosum]MCB6611334.1 hypothetical protein [[Clostridium] symbiosum]MCB6931131.1 hypothetical protein [[Clostridium] symbiosum]